jgi:hypothetical protein
MDWLLGGSDVTMRLPKIMQQRNTESTEITQKPQKKFKEETGVLSVNSVQFL